MKIDAMTATIRAMIAATRHDADDRLERLGADR